MDTKAFKEKLNKLAGNAVDSVATSVKTGLNAGSELVAGTLNVVDDSTDVLDSAIKDVATPTVKKLANIGIDNSKDLLGSTFEAGKNVVGSGFEATKNAFSNGKAYVTEKFEKKEETQETKPEKKMTDIEFIEKAEQEARAQLELAQQARDRLNNQA